jgi:NAD dependent epimerase/dehydratase family enzyme
VLPVPGFALKLAVGEFAESLLTGQRVIPARAEKEGYHFRYPDLQQAFRGIFGE